MASTDPIENLTYTVFFALSVAFASATQDIALDAYRIEAVAPRLQGAMAATYQAGYRVAMILASAGVLWIAAAVDPSADNLRLCALADRLLGNGCLYGCRYYHHALSSASRRFPSPD